ncbi:MAG: helix-turn-helix domain-containing protein [Mariprofundaceae bacterium]
MRHKEYYNGLGCPVEAAVEVIGGKWKGLILYQLRDGTKRFNELKRLIPGITQRMLTKQLKELEADLIISREVFPEVPPRVEYSLTKFGETLTPSLEALQAWGEQYIKKLSLTRTD